jgi:hypothetical protein
MRGFVNEAFILFLSKNSQLGRVWKGRDSLMVIVQIFSNVTIMKT